MVPMFCELPASKYVLPRVDRAPSRPRPPLGGLQVEAAAADEVGKAVGEGVEPLRAIVIRVEEKIGRAQPQEMRAGRRHFVRVPDVAGAARELLRRSAGHGTEKAKRLWPRQTQTMSQREALPRAGFLPDGV